MTDPTSPIREALEVAKAKGEGFLLVTGTTMAALLEAVEAAKRVVDADGGGPVLRPYLDPLGPAVERVEALLSSKARARGVQMLSSPESLRAEALAVLSLGRRGGRG